LARFIAGGDDDSDDADVPEELEKSKVAEVYSSSMMMNVAAECGCSVAISLLVFNVAGWD